MRTVEGELFHHRAHNEQMRERRGDLLIIRGLPVASSKLGISGTCDVVEFHSNTHGVTLHGEQGRWIPFPVEYKRGKPKDHQADELQLCAQAMCLEEMLCCAIPQGALFYGETRRRMEVHFTQILRSQVHTMLKEMHQLYSRRYTPKVKPSKGCSACSLKEVCLPILMRKKHAATYLRQAMEEEI